ncbi:MAG: SDR family NAD(P)-dependent oxidoreductase, partial [Chloroflexota bacterium]
MKYIITGGHSGIGLELTKMLLEEGHKLGLILRSQKKIEAAVKEIGTRENIDFFIADLSDQGQVRQIASEISDKWGYVDGLFNNAGVLLDQPYDSPQGNE